MYIYIYIYPLGRESKGSQGGGLCGLRVMVRRSGKVGRVTRGSGGVREGGRSGRVTSRKEVREGSGQVAVVADDDEKPASIR